MDYYEILGVSRSSEKEVIDAAYRALMKKYHPDRWQGDPAVGQEKARQLNAAYETLGDPHKRAAYDHQQPKTSNEAPKEEPRKHTSSSAPNEPRNARPQARRDPPPMPSRPASDSNKVGNSKKDGFAIASIVATAIIIFAFYVQTTRDPATAAAEAPNATLAAAPPSTTSVLASATEALNEGKGLVAHEDDPDLRFYLSDPAERRKLPTGEEYFTFGARIVNSGTQPLPVPPVLVQLRDQHERLVISWTTKANRTSLKPGEEALINESRIGIPEKAENLSLTFVQ